MSVEFEPVTNDFKAAYAYSLKRDIHEIEFLILNLFI